MALIANLETGFIGSRMRAVKAQNMIGAYGPWAASIVGNAPAKLSFRNPRFGSLTAWRRKALARTLECVAAPDMPWRPAARVERRFEHDGLEMEMLSWQLPYGPRTEAIFMKPAGSRGRLPAVLALHDHAGKKYWGWRKIARTDEAPHPLMTDHQLHYYGGAAWANEMAKRGYAVLAHDAFAFASRRVLYAEVPDVLAGKRVEPRLELPESIEEYNAWAGSHEQIMSKSLLCAGTTWPGVFWHEDRRALDYLCSRPDVDASRVACGGLSGGGLRTVMLAGLDPRIGAAFPAGFMSTWRDFLLNKCHTHTWMLYIPLLPVYLDFPEILGLRVPRPTFVLNDIDDSLYTLPEMKRADRILREVYRKAKASGNYRCKFYPGPHKFDMEMQKDAFEWVDEILR
jgi:dienelactone hydrolase